MGAFKFLLSKPCTLRFAVHAKLDFGDFALSGFVVATCTALERFCRKLVIMYKIPFYIQ